jgi:Mce-associated membrane protein
VADEVTALAKPSRWPLRVAVALVVVALAFAGWAGWTWWQAGHDESLGYAHARDEVLAAGRSDVALLTTLDSSDVDAGIARWLTVSAGPLRDELSATDAKTRKTLRDGGTVATGRVLDAAVSELDVRGGTAKLLVSVEIATSVHGGAPAAKRNRFVAGLTRTGHGWLLSALDQVPLGTQ